MEKEEIINQTLDILRRHLPGEEFKVLLFGSWAKGTAEATSDIDIGFLGPKAVDDLLLLRIKEEVRGIPTLRRVEVVDLSTTDERFRNDVLSYARVL